jgi:hypothetical protein
MREQDERMKGSFGHTKYDIIFEFVSLRDDE